MGKVIASEKFKRAYQSRRKWLRKGCSFKNGNSKPEVIVLEILRDLIVGAYALTRTASRVKELI